MEISYELLYKQYIFCYLKYHITMLFWDDYHHYHSEYITLKFSIKTSNQRFACQMHCFHVIFCGDCGYRSSHIAANAMELNLWTLFVLNTAYYMPGRDESACYIAETSKNLQYSRTRFLLIQDYLCYGHAKESLI